MKNNIFILILFVFGLLNFSFSQENIEKEMGYNNEIGLGGYQSYNYNKDLVKIFYKRHIGDYKFRLDIGGINF